jgi:hypothetical protein
MARLVTFRDAARVGGVSLETLLSTVNQTPWTAKDAVPPDTDDEDGPPEWMALVETARHRWFDARPLLEKDKEPFRAIMRQAAKVRAGGFLILDAPFDPAPLRRVLARKGFVAYGTHIGEDHWRTWFLKDPSLAAAATDQIADADDETAVARVWREDGDVHIDVRGLEPPQPMLAIIREIERDDGPAALTIHHEREPVFLYPELAERGWHHKLVDGDPGEVRLILWRDEGAAQ